MQAQPMAVASRTRTIRFASAREGVRHLLRRGVGALTAATSFLAISLAPLTVTAALALASQPAQASDDQQSSSSNSSTSAEQGNAALTEIIVTATKRSENILDVPLSISAITAEEIDRRGLVGAADYLRGVPGVNQSTEVNGNSIIIRGVETSGCCQNNLSGVTVATYFGETPTTNTGYGANVDLKLVDIERIEVLRGPQGTAFGNSSLGGAVRTIPVAPKLDGFEGRVGVNYSVTSGAGDDNNMIQGVGNIPLVRDKLALRASAYRFEESGFYSNVGGSDPTFQQRAAMLNAQAFAFDEEHTNEREVIGGRIAALWQASDNLRFTFTYLTQTDELTNVDGVGQSTQANSYDLVWMQGIAPEHQRRGFDDSFVYEDIDLANAVLEYDLGWGDLLATVSDVKSEVDRSILINRGIDPWSEGTMVDRRERVGEIRVATRLDGPWNFLGGVYAEQLDDEIDVTSIWYGDPAFNTFNPGGRFISGFHNIRDLKQKAAFGEASWEFLPGLTLTGGVRAYDYERDSVTVRTNAAGVRTGGNLLAADDNGTSFRGNLSYKPNDDALIYAGWSEGFRLGRPTAGLDPARCDLNGDGIVDGTTDVRIADTGNVTSDSVENIELGTKLTLLDQRLTMDAAIFRIDWTGVPFFVRAPLRPVGCNDAYTANAGGAVVEGIELQTQFRLTSALRLDAGASRMDTRLTEDAPAAGAVKGSRLVNSPKFNANLGLQYEFDIAGNNAYVRVDSIYVGSYYGSITQVPDSIGGDYVKVDASARVTLGSLDVDLFLRNLTDADEYTFRYGGLGNEFQGTRLRPRTIGMQLSYAF